MVGILKSLNLLFYYNCYDIIPYFKSILFPTYDPNKDKMTFEIERFRLHYKVLKLDTSKANCFLLSSLDGDVFEKLVTFIKPLNLADVSLSQLCKTCYNY